MKMLTLCRAVRLKLLGSYSRSSTNCIVVGCQPGHFLRAAAFGAHSNRLLVY